MLWTTPSRMTLLSARCQSVQSCNSSNHQVYLASCRYELCDMSDADKWIKRASARCHDCVSTHNICAHPPKLTIHMYLSYLDQHNWKGNLIAIKAYLLTQNLLKTQLWLWTDSIDTVVNDDTRHFFHTFAEVVTVKTFDWHEEIAGMHIIWQAHMQMAWTRLNARPSSSI